MNGYIKREYIGKSYQRNNRTNNLIKIFTKTFLKEDSSIDSKKARFRLFKEAGIKASYQDIIKALEDLRKEFYQNCTSLRSRNTEKSTTYRSNEKSKVKACHILLLKSYLIKNPSITSAQARYRLYKDTNLDVATSTIKIYLSALRKILDSECANLGSYNLKYLVRNKHVTRNKMKPFHINILKKYLKEIRLITPAQARLRFRMETGLEVCISTIKKYLFVLRIEVDNESINHDPCISVPEANVNHCIVSSLKSDSINIISNALKEDKYTEPAHIEDKFHGYKGVDTEKSVFKIHSEFINKNIPSEWNKNRSNNSAAEVESCD